jgi:purine-binding chemotaxis protein CheW
MAEPASRPQALAERGRQWIVAYLDQTAYAIPSDRIAQIEMAERITPVPNAPSFVRGVAFLRGEVVPVVDLRVRLGLAPLELGLASRTVVVEVGQRRVGLLVDRAREVIYARDDEIVPPPESAAGASHVEGVIARQDRLLLVLDVEKVVAAAPEAPADVQPPVAHEVSRGGPEHVL